MKDDNRMAVALTILAVYDTMPDPVVEWVWSKSNFEVGLLFNQFGYKDWLARGERAETFETVAT